MPASGAASDTAHCTLGGPAPVQLIISLDMLVNTATAVSSHDNCRLQFDRTRWKSDAYIA